MTIRFTKSWNGYYEGQIVSNPAGGNTEAQLIALGYAVSDLDGPDNSFELAKFATDSSNNVTGLVGPGGKPFFPPSYLPELYDTALDLPGTIAGLQLWIDASDPMYTASYAARVATASDTVSLWPDKSANAQALVAVGSPKYSPTGHNGKPAVAFNTNSYFTLSSWAALPNFDSAMTLFIVGSRSDASGNAVSFGCTAAGGTKTFYAQRDTSTGYSGLTASGTTGAGTVRVINQAITDMYVYDGANITVFADGFFRAASSAGNSSTSGVTSAACTGALGLLSTQTIGVGALGDGTYKWPGTISEVIMYSAALSAADQKRVLKYLAKKWAPSSKRVVTCIGDSLTSGTGSSGTASQAVSIAGTNYPGQAWASLGASGYDVRIDAYPGRTLTQMLAEAQVATWTGNTGYGSPVTVIWGGTNTLTIGRSAGAAIQQIQRLALGYKQAGHKVVILTCLPRGDAIYAGFPSDRGVYNAFLLANYTKFADAVVDVAADSRLQNTANTTYFDADKIHLTNAGYAVVASLVAPVVAAL